MFSRVNSYIFNHVNMYICIHINIIYILNYSFSDTSSEWKMFCFLTCVAFILASTVPLSLRWNPSVQRTRMPKSIKGQLKKKSVVLCPRGAWSSAVLTRLSCHSHLLSLTGAQLVWPSARCSMPLSRTDLHPLCRLLVNFSCQTNPFTSRPAWTKRWVFPRQWM